MNDIAQIIMGIEQDGANFGVIRRPDEEMRAYALRLLDMSYDVQRAGDHPTARKVRAVYARAFTAHEALSYLVALLYEEYEDAKTRGRDTAAISEARSTFIKLRDGNNAC